MPQDFPEDPIEVFKRNISISPFWEEDLGALAELIGEDNVLFGSDYPHPEGLADPVSYVNELQGVSEETVRKIMGGNLARLMNLDANVPTPAQGSQSPNPSELGMVDGQRGHQPSQNARAPWRERVGQS